MKKIKLYLFLFLFPYLSCFGKLVYFNDSGEEDLVSKDIYATRRYKLMEQMDNGVALFMTGEFVARKVGAHYEYRPESNFYYLTGFSEPNAVFLLLPGQEKSFIMFVQTSSPRTQTWTGYRAGIEGAMNKFGADTAYPIQQFEEFLPKYLESQDNLYFNLYDRELKDKISDFISQQVDENKPDLKNVIPLVHEMRAFKDKHEVMLLQKAIDITCKSHIEAFKTTKPGKYEYEIEAVIEYIYRKNGARRPGFASIVGSGPNSTILHYEESSRKMMDGDLLLMDIGAEYERYSADITRTIPVNGKFSNEQKEIYELVLQSQKEAIKLMIPGNRVLTGHMAAVEIISEGLLELGLMTDRNSRWQRQFYVLYHSSHWLGLDVHDAGDYGWDKGRGSLLLGERGLGRILEPGMVLTIEPGLYLSKERWESIQQIFGNNVAEDELNDFIQKVGPIYKKYQNIGVRIEDDILITKNGNNVLSVAAPKEIAEIEKIMTESSSIFR